MKKAGKEASKSSPKAAKTILFFTILLVIVMALVYFARIYSRTEEASGGGIQFCEQGRCFLTTHIHADVEGMLCGEQVKLPLEKGPLDDVHTHKERNKLHWHAPLEVHPETKEVLDWGKLTLGNSFAQLGFAYADGCFGEWCTGKTMCDGKLGTLTIRVNGQEADEEYVWKDGDKIEVNFQ